MDPKPDPKPGSVIHSIAGGVAQTRRLKISFLHQYQYPLRILIKAASCKMWNKLPEAVKIKHFFLKDIRFSSFSSFFIFTELFQVRLLC